MSRIIRFDQNGPRRIDDVDLRQKTFADSGAPRPAGGFQNCGAQAAGETPLSYVEQREREAQRLLEEAQRQAETIQRDAYHAGFEQGERAGEKFAAQKLEPTLQAFQRLVEAAGQARAELIEEERPAIIKIAFALATAVLHRTLEIEPDAVADVVMAALAKAGESTGATLYLSPHDRQLVEQQMQRRQAGVWPPAGLTIEVDEGVGRGGCRVHTTHGNIDATIETQLRALKALLWEH